MISAQGYINNNFPKQGRLGITDLEISQKNLEGHLDLRDFANLKKLDCSPLLGIFWIVLLIYAILDASLSNFILGSHFFAFSSRFVASD